VESINIADDSLTGESQVFERSFRSFLMTCSASVSKHDRYDTQVSRMSNGRLDTNLNGTFLSSREALKIMRPQRSGAIINISSPQGKKGKLLRGAYSAAKFGVEGLTQVLALESEAYNIRANCLDPGGIVATEAIKNIPGNRGVRMLSPEIVRACAVYLASDESSGITGQSFVATEWNKQHGIEVPYVVA